MLYNIFRFRFLFIYIYINDYIHIYVFIFIPGTISLNHNPFIFRNHNFPFPQHLKSSNSSHIQGGVSSIQVGTQGRNIIQEVPVLSLLLLTERHSLIKQGFVKTIWDGDPLAPDVKSVLSSKFHFFFFSLLPRSWFVSHTFCPDSHAIFQIFKSFQTFLWTFFFIKRFNYVSHQLNVLQG